MTIKATESTDAYREVGDRKRMEQVFEKSKKTKSIKHVKSSMH